MKLSAVQAAFLIGRNERRVRDWIATGRLAAIKVGRTWQIDADDLLGLPGVQADQQQLALLQTSTVSTTQSLLGHIATLEQTLRDLHSELTLLRERMETLERQISEDSDATLTLSRRFSSFPSYTDLSNHFPFPSDQKSGGSLLAGSVRMKQFALLHNVPAAVLTYQLETGKVTDTSLVMANGRKAHWLTPRQQCEVIAFWQRNGTSFTSCPACPHKMPI